MTTRVMLRRFRTTGGRTAEGANGPRHGTLLRLAPAAIFVLLMVIAIFAAVRIETGIERARRSERLSTEFHRLHVMIPPENADLWRLAGGPLVGVPEFVLHSLEQRLPAALHRIAAIPGESGTARRIAAGNRRIRSLEQRYATLISAGKPRQAHDLFRQALAPAFIRTHRIIDEQVAALSAQANNKLADVEHAQETSLVVLPIAFLIGGALLAFLWVRERRRRLREAETKAQMRVLERAALSDSLTGLRNHRSFHEDLLARVEIARATNADLCVLMLDLEGLKELNDTHGHQVGDERLRALARALRNAVPDEEVLYRVGGDEFAVVLPGATAWSGFEVANRIRDALQNEADRAEVAVGVAELNGAGDKDSLIHRADLALLSAKRSSRKIVAYSFDLEPPQRAEPEEEAEEHRRAVLASALAHAVDAKDSYTRSHSETVSTLCVQIAARMGLAARQVAKLRIAGLLHDVGKIGTPDNILNKPAKLTDEEFDVMKKHPVLGASIARSAELVEEANWILHHHERPDGRGYPHGLAGEEIPIESRIILVADAFEALISDRPYRSGRPAQAALEEIERNVPDQFDARPVAALREVVQGGEAVEPGGPQGAPDGDAGSAIEAGAASTQGAARA